MKQYESKLLKSFQDEPENGYKPKEQVKDRILQSKVSEARLREIDYFVQEDGCYDSRSDFVRQAIENELDGGEMVLPEGLWDKIHRLTERADLPSHKVALHEIVKSAKKHYEEKYGIEVDVK